MISGTHALMAKLLYGAGLRLMECVRLRIQDIDFGQNIFYVRGGKGVDFLVRLTGMTKSQIYPLALEIKQKEKYGKVPKVS
jgi:integrase